MRCLVTGSAGFIGRAVAAKLFNDGHQVIGFDSQSGQDIRNETSVIEAAMTMDAIFHLAYINGTGRFYEEPELILDVAVRGMLNVITACASCDVRRLVTFSSSEVYQQPPVLPTPEDVPLVVPDPRNPRYSYGGGKILYELMAMHCGKLEQSLVIRPHNVYGPNMGWLHVIPQTIMKIARLGREETRLPIKGSGYQTRSFIYIDDFCDGLMTAFDKTQGRNIVNIGSSRELPIIDLVSLVAECMGKKIEIVPGQEPEGETNRRCPDIAKLKQYGFEPRVSLEAGIAKTVSWYMNHQNLWPQGVST